MIAAPIKLELLTWSSQKLVTRVAEILMREKLGYLDVSVRDYSGSGEDTSGYAYNRTASGEVSFNFELWPTFYEKEREAEGRSQRGSGRVVALQRHQRAHRVRHGIVKARLGRGRVARLGAE